MVGDGFGGRAWYKPTNYTVGSYSAYTICGDSHQLYGWGANHHRELGDGTTVHSATPIKVLGMTNVKYYSTGYNMGAIKFDSTGWYWGSPVSNVPVKLLDSVKFLDAGAQMCTFVKYDGTVWSVGRNHNGIFGNDTITTTVSTTPQKAKNINNAVRVAVSRFNMAILCSDGSVWITGSNSNGGLGNKSNFSTVAKVAVKNPKLKKIVDVKGTATNIIALDSAGYVYSWGAPTGLGLGINNKQDSVSRIPGLSNIVAISGCDDGFHFFALDINHDVYAWGTNYGGALGSGNGGSVNTPILVAKDAIDIMAGETFSYIVKTDNTLWATGKSNGGSIWMNLKDTTRLQFTEIDPTVAPLNMCKVSAAVTNYFRILSHLCVYDSVAFVTYKNDSFDNFNWDFGDGSGRFYGLSKKHKYAQTGQYTVKLFSNRKSNNAEDTVTRVIEIVDADRLPLFNGDTAMCGQVAYTKKPINTLEDNIYQWQDGVNSAVRFIDNPGQYILKSTDINGCYYFDTFKVVSHELPKALYEADTYRICANSKNKIRFKNTSSCTDPIVKSRWDFTEDTLWDNSQYVDFKFTKAQYIPVWLSVWSIYGCKNDTIDVFDILAVPKPNFTTFVSDSCLNGNGVFFTNKTVKDTVNNPRFKWYFSEGYVLSNKNPAGKRHYIDTGKFYVDLIYVNSNTCTDTMRKWIHIYPHPKALFSLKDSICSRDSIVITNSSSSSYLPLTYNWQFGDGESSIKAQPKHLFKTNGSFRVSLITHSPYGCLDSMNKLVAVFKPPTVDFSINDSIQCINGNSFTFKSNAKADVGNLISQDWTYGDLTYDVGSNPADKSFPKAQKYIVQLMVKDQFNCTNTLSRWVDVRPMPVVKFNINDASQCINQQQFDFNYKWLSGNDSITLLNWNIGSNNYQTPTVRLANFSEGKHPIQLTLQTDQGCMTSLSQYIVVNPQPLANFNIINNPQCFDGHSYNFTNTSSISSGSIAQYEWRIGFGPAITSKDVNNVKYPRFGHYPVELKCSSDSGCIAYYNSGIDILPSPVVDIDLVKPVCVNQTSMMKSLSHVDSGFIQSYDWQLGDGTSSTDSCPVHTYSQPGQYNLRLTVLSNNGCSSNKTFPAWAMVRQLPTADFKYILSEGTQNNNVVDFRNLSYSNIVQSFWQFGRFGKAIHDTSISLQDTATIPVKLWVMDQYGCVNQIQRSIFTSGPLLLFMPNAFTPNHDMLNDGFGPQGVVNAQTYNYQIFNRWGELLFETNSVQDTWDGKYQGENCPQDVYAYSIQLTDMFGRFKSYRGSFTLIR